MKIYAYKVKPEDDSTKPLEQAFEFYGKWPLDQRMRDLPGSRVRLENLQKRGGLYFANFVIFRGGSGPVIVSEQRPMSEIAIKDDESFGEDTACLYDPQAKYLLIQYNHHGPKASAIQAYLAFAEGDLTHRYTLAPKLSEASEERIRGLRLVSKVEVTFAVPELISENNASSVSVGGALDLAKKNGADTLELVLGNRRGLIDGAIKDLIVDLFKISPGDPGIKKLTLRAQSAEDAPRETIDLIAERLCSEVDIPLRLGRRYSLADRWEQLAIARQSWIKAGFLI
ncbi:MAG: DUF6731 family protein [Vulcanococcus sp.]